MGVIREEMIKPVFTLKYYGTVTKKNDRLMRLSMDYWKLSNMIIKNKYPLLRIDDWFD